MQACRWYTRRWLASDTDGLAGNGEHGGHATVSASQEKTLAGTGAR